MQDFNERVIADYTRTPITGTVSIKLARVIAPMEARVRIEKGGVIYDYRLRNDGSAEIFPLQMGNGEYSIRVLLGPAPDGSGRYAVGFAGKYNLRLTNPHAVFLNPNQFVHYAAEMRAIRAAKELCKGRLRDFSKVQAIYSYIIKILDDDMNKANRVMRGEMAGYIPDIDDTLSSGQAICFGYSVLFAAMLRSQGIPCKLVLGNVTNPDPRAPKGSMVYHAWNEFYVREPEEFNINKMMFRGNRWNRVDLTFYDSAGGSQEVMDFKADDKNYNKFREY